MQPRPKSIDIWFTIKFYCAFLFCMVQFSLKWNFKFTTYPLCVFYSTVLQCISSFDISVLSRNGRMLLAKGCFTLMKRQKTFSVISITSNWQRTHLCGSQFSQSKLAVKVSCDQYIHSTGDHFFYVRVQYVVIDWIFFRHKWIPYIS